MRHLKFASLFISIMLLFGACARSENSSYNAPAKSAESEDYAEGRTANKSAGTSNAPTAPAAQVSLEQADKSQPAAPVVTERKIIRNADLTLESDALEETQQKITTMAESKGGFVIESQRRISDVKATKTDTVTMTVRVPAAKFEESLEEVRKSANRVTDESVKGQDVTEEFIDVEARLKAKRAVEEQFLEIMKRGNTVQDALNVQRELGTVRSEIEQIEGRKRFLENQTSFSTLKITLRTPGGVSTSSSGFFYQLGKAVSDGFSAAMTFLFVLITLLIALLPFLIFIVLPIYLLIRYFLRRHRKQQTANEIAREEIKNE